MGDSPTQESSKQASGEDAQPEVAVFRPPSEDMVFGGEPAEISPPPRPWPVSGDQATQISNRPPLAPRPEAGARPT